MNGFYWSIKLKAHFRDDTKVKEQREENVFKKPANKNWAPNKNLEAFIEVTKTESQMGLELCVLAGPPTFLKKNKKHQKN